MFPGINPKQMKMAMKKMGISQEEINAREVIIICEDRKLVISNPQVSKVKAMGQVTLQIVGEIEEHPLEKFSEDDIKIVMEQASCSKEEAKKALEETNDLAEAILRLKKDG